MNKLDEILTYKSLAFKHGADTSGALDMVISQNQDNPALQAVTKNVCAHLSVGLVERLEDALSILEMSKRQFIEISIIDALDRFDSIASKYDIFAPHYVDPQDCAELEGKV
jgi:hypothetical protein